MKWAIMLNDLRISGGANVIFEHALYAHARGIEITFVSLTYQEPETAAWHKGTDNFKYCTLDDVREIYDVAIATEWSSAFDCYKIKAQKYIYFVQSIESRFFKKPDSMIAYVANTSYELGYNFITEATWIKKYLEEKYHHNVSLVLNGIDKNIFNCEGESYRKEVGKVRFLVEGSVKSWFKNVLKAIELCKKAGADDIWLVTPDEVKSYPGVSRIFNRVPIEQMSKIYRSCDVLVKLSVVEGMFGPPLEMFHCGGTAVVYNVEGADEYIKNGYNAIVVEKNDEDGVVTAIKSLLMDYDKINYLKMNALQTAKKWIDWNKSSSAFYDCVCKTPLTTSEEYSNFTYKAEMGAVAYRKAVSIFGAEVDEERIRNAADIACSQHLNLFIFGAGYYSKSTIIAFSKYDIVISGVIVSNTANNPLSVLGHKVISVADIEEKDQCLIYISVKNNRSNILKLLNDKGFKYVV